MTSDFGSLGSEVSAFWASAVYCVWSPRPFAVSSTCRTAGFCSSCCTLLADVTAAVNWLMARATAGCFAVVWMSVVWLASACDNAGNGFPPDAADWAAPP